MRFDPQRRRFASSIQPGLDLELNGELRKIAGRWPMATDFTN